MCVARQMTIISFFFVCDTKNVASRNHIHLLYYYLCRRYMKMYTKMKKELEKDEYLICLMALIQLPHLFILISIFAQAFFFLVYVLSSNNVSLVSVCVHEVKLIKWVFTSVRHFFLRWYICCCKCNHPNGDK